MTKHLKIKDLDNFQEDLSQEFAATDLSIVQGGIATKELSIDSDERLIAYPLPEPEPTPYPLPPWPPYPCGCYPYPRPYPKPDKPIKLDNGDSIDSVYIGWCPVIL